MIVNKPLVITMGDPTGVGPEIILQAAMRGAFEGLSHSLIVAGDLNILKRAARMLGEEVEVSTATESPLATERIIISGTELNIRCLSDLNADDQHYGCPNNASGEAMAAYIDWACSACLKGHASGMITAPINKKALRSAGYSFPGHTEMLAERCQINDVVMMLAGEQLKVCLVTTHCSHNDVSRKLSASKILSTIRIANECLQRQFGLSQPRLAVLALNPHAGEGGLFGDEEARHIAPAIAAARDEGIIASGPYSADTLFHFAVQGNYDAVICMYHDQGLIPLKLLHFADSVNVTLGLPIVRTSVDHGTAYELAGTGNASPGSLVAAVKMADYMAMKQARDK